MRETIAAPATYMAESAIGVIRVSGDDAFRIVLPSLKKRNLSPIDEGAIEHRRLQLALFVNREGKVVDEVLFAPFKEPHSYTGENIVEIYCHGNPSIMEEIIDTLVEAGARVAEPGEFTRRAFLNGKLDLTQAEGVLSLISSTSHLGRSLAMAEARGELSKRLSLAKRELFEALTEIEAAMDFPEEGLETASPPELTQRLRSTKEHLEEMVDGFEVGEVLVKGASVALAGRPNVGKSSLLNALTQKDRSIVTPIPGTTRDVVEERIELNGVTVLLKDTAGLREPKDQVEKLGMNRTLREMERSHLVVMVLDSSEPLGREEEMAAELARPYQHRLLVALNKCDLPQQTGVKDAERLFPNTKVVQVSALTGEGLTELKEVIRTAILKERPEKDLQGVMLTNLRHKECLQRALIALERAIDSINKELPLDLVSSDLNEAIDAIDEITGERFTADLLDSIFSKFCVGK